VATNACLSSWPASPPAGCQEGLGPLLLAGKGRSVLGQNLPAQEPVEVLTAVFRAGGRGTCAAACLRFGPDQLVASKLDRQAPNGFRSVSGVPRLARLWALERPTRRRWSGSQAHAHALFAAARGAHLGWPSATSSPMVRLGQQRAATCRLLLLRQCLGLRSCSRLSFSGAALSCGR